MLTLRRICIPVGLDCNLDCKYCMRKINTPDIPTIMSPMFKEYIKKVDESWCNALVVTGGEPLLYMDTVKTLFDMANSKVHKKIISNCSLLTEELVHYINSNNIELCISHDGKSTKIQRGVDVLEDRHIINLIPKINLLSVNCVTTNYNTDIVENYVYLRNILQRDDFIYNPFVCMPNGYNDDFIKDFNYDLFAKSYMEYLMYYNTRNNSPFYNRSNEIVTEKCAGFNILLDGSVVSMLTLNKYGHVNMNTQELVKIKNAHPDMKFCRDYNCKVRDECLMQGQMASEHLCKSVKATVNMTRYFNSLKGLV